MYFVHCRALTACLLLLLVFSLPARGEDLLADVPVVDHLADSYGVEIEPPPERVNRELQGEIRQTQENWLSSKAALESAKSTARRAELEYRTQVQERQSAERLLRLRLDSYSRGQIAAERVESSTAAVAAEAEQEQQARSALEEQYRTVESMASTVATLESSLASMQRELAEWKEANPRPRYPFEGIVIRRNSILVMLNEKATTEALADLLQRYRLSDPRRLPGWPIVIVRTSFGDLPDSERGFALRHLLLSLNDEPIVYAATLDRLISTTCTVGCTAESSASNWNWADQNSLASASAIQLMRFPAAWRVIDRYGKSAEPTIGLLDVGFPRHSDIPDPLPVTSSICSSGTRLHGMQVLSVMASRDDGMGISGVNRGGTY